MRNYQHCNQYSYLFIGDLVTVSNLVNVTVKVASILALIVAFRLTIVQTCKGAYYLYKKMLTLLKFIYKGTLKLKR